MTAQRRLNKVGDAQGVRLLNADFESRCVAELRDDLISGNLGSVSVLRGVAKLTSRDYCH